MHWKLIYISKYRLYWIMLGHCASFCNPWWQTWWHLRPALARKKEPRISHHLDAHPQLHSNLLEQCNLTGGKHSSLAISVFLIWPACSSVMPRTRSVMKLLEAMAEPQPNVLNLTSTILPVASSTLICSFITSPQAGAPTRPVPTSVSVLGNDPTLRGRS